MWALIEPDNFGSFFVSGDYVGWDEELTHYYNEDMPASVKADFPDAGSYISEVSYKFSFPAGSPVGRGRTLTPIEPHEFPKWYEAEKGSPSLGSMILLTNRLWAIDDVLKNIIERLEPGAHFFSPIAITLRNGKVLASRYHVLVIGLHLDSFRPDRSDPECFSESRMSADTYYITSKNKKNVSGLSLSRSAVGGAHLWRERKLEIPDIWMSDVLRGEIVNAGLRMPKILAGREVDG